MPRLPRRKLQLGGTAAGPRIVDGVNGHSPGAVYRLKAKVNRHFTTDDAPVRLKRLYPIFEM